jgi:prepilin peptidase CpaA
MTADLLLLLFFLPVIFGSAISDFNHLKIRNVQVIVGLALFLVISPLLLDLNEISFRLLSAVLTFGICFILFSLRLIGGGDAKMMPVVLLFVPTDEVVLFLRIFAGALLLVSLGALFIQRSPRLRRAGWTTAQERRQVPVGVAMALSAAALAAYMVLRP